MDKEIKITVTLKIQTSETISNSWTAKALYQNGVEYCGTPFNTLYETEAAAIKALKRVVKEITPD